MAERVVISGVAPGAIAGVPYADMAEATGPPVVDLVTDTYREFLATDARSILAVLYPQHYNFILNPAMRVNTSGWSVTGSPMPPSTTDLSAAVSSDVLGNTATANAIRASSPDGDIVTFTYTADKPLLAQATNRWDAASVGSDRLYDLSGDGKDAVFGAGANKPTVLPYNGTTYWYEPYRTDANSGSWRVTAAPAVTTAQTLQFVIHGTLTHRTTGTASQLFQYGTSVNGWGVQCGTTGLVSSSLAQNSSWNSASGPLKTGGFSTKPWHRFTLNMATTISLYEDSEDGVIWTPVQAGVVNHPSITQPLVANDIRLGAGSLSQAVPGTYYSAEVWAAGVKVAEFLPQYVDKTTYATATNTGTTGGNWALTRATTGLKSSVVDRPLLLFSGNQWATATMPQKTGSGTMLLALRSFADTVTSGFLVTEPSPGLSGEGGQYMTRTGGSLAAVNVVYVGTDTSTNAPFNMTNGQQVIGGRLTSPTTFEGLLNGARAPGAIDSAINAGAYLIYDRVTFGGTATLASHMEFLGAAYYNRALTDPELLTASNELIGVLDANPPVTTHTYTLQTGGSIPKATVPFPTVAGLIGYTYWTSINGLDSNESWVGRSFHLSGEGTIRFKDPDGPYVYTGPTADLVDEEWYEPGRGSAEWTYSAYVMGPCKVKLFMDAYAPTDYTKAKSPPRWQSLPVVADAMTAPYDAAKPAIIHQPTGNVWTLKEPPFYRSIGVPPTVANPSTLVPSVDTPDLYVQDASKYIWKLIPERPSAAPYYTKGTFQPFVDKLEPAWNPYTAPPVTNEPYVRYVTLTPDPGAHPDILSNTIWEINSQATLTSYSYYEDTGSKAVLGSFWSNDWITIPAGEWKRVVLKTGVREGHNPVSFLGCYWIDAYLEFKEAEGARFSAFMLDPTEWPEAQYFDGSMTESAVLDDFMWATNKPEDINNSVSEYYYDRLVRVRFLTDHLRHHVPVGRPIQIFFGTYDDPYIIPEQVIQGLQHRL